MRGTASLFAETLFLVSFCSVGKQIDLEARLHLCEDKDFHQIHEQIIKSSAALKSACQGSKLAVSLQMLSGEAGHLRREQEQRRLKKQKCMVEARKLGFPNVILPGDVRNDLYLTVEQGYFDRSGKARNVEVSVVVVGRDGRVVEDQIFFAAGLTPASKVAFPVLFHTNSPVWNETVRLAIPIERFEGAHIRLEFRHCSSESELQDVSVFADARDIYRLASVLDHAMTFFT